MARIAVLGAGGLVGRLGVAALHARGHVVVQVVRREAGVVQPRTGDDGPGRGEERRVPDPDDRAGWRRLLADVDAAVWASGPAGLVDAAVDAVAVGGLLIDVEPGQAHLRRVLDDLGPRARSTGARLAPGMGFQHVVGSLLAGLAARELAAPSEAHVAYALPDARLLAQASPGRRASVVAELGADHVALEHGEQVAELAGERRRLAWFPRPIGPSHAAGIPGGEALAVPTHVAGLATVRTYVALSSARSELLQALATLVRRPRGRRWAERRLSRPRPEPPPAVRAGWRWACVAEVAGGGDLARAWAYGRDPYRLTAESAALAVDRVLAGRLPPGVVLPGDLGAPREVLDDLGVRTDTRWSLRHGPGVGPASA